MNTSRKIIFLIVALILMNLVLTGFLLFRRPPHPGLEAYHFLVHELQLSDKQEEQYRQLRDDHHAAVTSIRDEMGELRDRLYAGPPEESSALIDSIAGLQGEVERITYQHFQALRKICEPRQQERFDEIIAEAVRKMAPPKPL